MKLVCLRLTSSNQLTVIPKYFCFAKYLKINKTLCNSAKVLAVSSSCDGNNISRSKIKVDNITYICDKLTNVTPRVLSYVGHNLHLLQNHPINLIKLRLINYMYARYPNRRGNPVFSVHDKLSPVVTIEQNFDSLLVPTDHPSRKAADSYYINSHYMLRAHTSAHQKDLISSGLNNFLIIGDCYRRDAIDSAHYPVFHQVEGVRLLSSYELHQSLPTSESFPIFEKGIRRSDKQENHTLEAVKLVERDLKLCLLGLVEKFFGTGIQYRWVDAYFPFTHPSWELEIFHENKWMEVLGCGIIEQQILKTAGAEDKIGWAFGIGLDRLAMKLYSIPDIRVFWSKDTGFLSQFAVDDPETPITYKVISRYPQCINDISFLIPETYHHNDFYDLARSIGGDTIEQIQVLDEFFHPKLQKPSKCYRLVYRHMERTLTKGEVNEIHKQIETAAVKYLNVVLR